MIQLTNKHKYDKMNLPFSIHIETLMRRSYWWRAVELRPIVAQNFPIRRQLATLEGVEMTAAFLSQTMVCDGQPFRRHRNGGGWVPANQDEGDDRKPFVAESAYVGPFARVFGAGRVTDTASISGAAHVAGDARVFGNAVVTGNARVYGGQIGGNAWIGETTYIYEGIFFGGRFPDPYEGRWG